MRLLCDPHGLPRLLQMSVRMWAAGWHVGFMPLLGRGRIDKEVSCGSMAWPRWQRNVAGLRRAAMRVNLSSKDTRPCCLLPSGTLLPP